jgi:hypothetical protein
MAVTVDLDYTYNGQEVFDVLLEPALQNEDILKMFNVLTNIRSKRQMITADQFGRVSFAGDGTCDIPTPVGSTVLKNRTLETGEVQIYMTQCAREFSEVLAEEALNTGIEIYDLSQTEINNKIILPLLQEAAKRDLFYLISFGDLDSADELLSAAHGLWPTLIDGVDDYTVIDAEVTFNAILEEDEALEAFEKMWSLAPQKLKAMKDKIVLAVTGSLYDNYEKSLRDKGIDNGWTRLQEGTPSLKFNGIEVVPMRGWDNGIAEFELDNPHRALLTVKENHYIGVEDMKKTATLSFFYDRNSRLNKYEGRYRVGYQFVHKDLQVIAY